MLDIIILILYLGGLLFNLSAVVGIIRLPDLYCRLHASSKNTTLGSVLIALGLGLRAYADGNGPAALKILLIISFLFVVTPIGAHALARAAYLRGTPMWRGSVCDQYARVLKARPADDAPRSH